MRKVEEIEDQIAKLNDIIIPTSLEAPKEIATYLDDLFHELSGPGDRIEILC
jgi:hypothetical protein